MSNVTIRFYEELNDFLSAGKKKVRFTHFFTGRVSVKDLIESIGVPHTAIDLILINEKSVGFDHIVNNGDDISVYPVFESLNIQPIQRLRPEPLREIKFIADVHLGALVKLLRMMGFDVTYRNDFTEADIAKISIDEKRIILTKSRSALKRKEITHGYWIRGNDPIKQAAEVLNRFDLAGLIREFSRCLICGAELLNIDKSEAADRIPPKVKIHCDEFFKCSACNKIFWNGTHYVKMTSTIKRIKNELKII